MGFVDLLLLPTAVIIAAVGYFAEQKRYVFCIAGSFICCSIVLLVSIWDMNQRAAVNDLSGVRDIYPTMQKVFLIVFLTISLINVATIRRKR